MADILVAEDDAKIRLYMSAALEDVGHDVRCAADGVEAMRAYGEKRPDVLVLDLMMPRKSGFDVCEEIRKKDVALPILIVTAKGEESDKVLAFGLGADDYLVKPFSMKELELRIAAILRRQRVGETSGRLSRDRFAFGSHRVDADRFMLVDKQGGETALTSLELGILRLLSAHAGDVISRERFINELWGVSYYGTQRTLDTRISTLRQKLGADGERIASVRSVGYRYTP